MCFDPYQATNRQTIKSSHPGNASLLPNSIEVSPWCSSRVIRIRVSLSSVLRRHLKTLLRCQGLKISLTTPTIERARPPQLRAKTRLSVLFITFSSRFQELNQIVSSSVHSLPPCLFSTTIHFRTMHICLLFSKQYSLFLVRELAFIFLYSQYNI